MWNILALGQSCHSQVTAVFISSSRATATYCHDGDIHLNRSPHEHLRRLRILLTDVHVLLVTTTYGGYLRSKWWDTEQKQHFLRMNKDFDLCILLVDERHNSLLDGIFQRDLTRDEFFKPGQLSFGDGLYEFGMNTVAANR